MAERSLTEDTQSERLAAALYLVIYEAHRSYANTSGWHGGIGGQAITMGCAFKDPAPDQLWAEMDMPSKPLREYMEAHPDFDLKATAEALKTELAEKLK